MMKKNIFSMLFLMMAVGLSSTEQHWIVTGTVTTLLWPDPIVGATVMVHGTSTGTVTDMYGCYVLVFHYNPHLSGKSLDFSALGFLPARASIPADLEVNIALEPDSL